MSNDGFTWTVQSPYIRSLLAGAVAGTCTDISLYPLDTLKTRLQSKEGFLKSGGFRNIYRGIGSVTIGSAPSAALFFVTYDSAKRFLLDLTSRSTVHDAKTAAACHMIAGSLGETAGCLIRVPVEVIKQRAQAVQFNSSREAFMHIVRTNDGLQFVRELYRGGGITLMREIPFTIIQFPLWEALKSWHVARNLSIKNASKSSDEVIGVVPSALYGCVAGAIGAGLTTPLDVLKTRLMLEPKRVKASVMFRRILSESGTKALFAGIVPRVGWISVGGAVFLGSYQWASNAMDERREQSSAALL